MPTRPTAFELEVLTALAGEASLAAALLEAWSRQPLHAPQTPALLVRHAQLAVTAELGAQNVLDRAARAGLATVSSTGYVARPDGFPAFARLALMLRSIAHYRQCVHEDSTTAHVVLTRPAKPSRLEAALNARGLRAANLEVTERAFLGMAGQARQRVVVMTPFLDLEGADWLRELFSRVAPSVARVLILRWLDAPGRQDYPVGYERIAPWLHDQGVRVLNYSVPRLGAQGFETFHAKLVLCDEEHAYVGSTNITAASLSHSMEMGVALRGKAAREVAVVVEAVMAVAQPYLSSHS